MKVLGKTDGGYLVEATLAELIEVAGGDRGFLTQQRGTYSQTLHAPTGTVINVSERYRHLTALEATRDHALNSAGVLRSLASLIEKSIPEGLIAPAKPEEPSE